LGSIYQSTYALSRVIAWAIARMISSHSLYAIATPEPAGEIVESGLHNAVPHRRRGRATVIETVGTSQQHCGAVFSNRNAQSS
jgi:hypothetical protein